MYQSIALSLSIDAAVFAFTHVSMSLRTCRLPTPHTTPRPCPWTTGVIKAGESEALWGYRYSRATVRESLGSLRALHLRPCAIRFFPRIHMLRPHSSSRMSIESFRNQQVVDVNTGAARDVRGDRFEGAYGALGARQSLQYRSRPRQRGDSSCEHA